MKSKDAITFRTRGVLFSIILFLLCSRTCSAATSRIGPSVEKLLVQNSQLPQLILISGCTGTGKSTFGMEVAIKEGILKCISTDTIRQVMRSCCEMTGSCSLALQRSSFQGDDDPVVNWLEACEAVDSGIDSIVNDSIKRGTSLVLEGVHIAPDAKLLERWTSAGGLAVGCVLTIPDAEVHRNVIERRGELTRKGAANQLNSIQRIRCIHDEMVRRGNLHDWVLIEQKPRLEPKPIDLLTSVIRSRYLEGYFDLDAGPASVKNSVKK